MNTFVLLPMGTLKVYPVALGSESVIAVQSAGLFESVVLHTAP